MNFNFDLTSEEIQEKARSTAQKEFDRLMNLPQYVRHDEKQRTGIQVFVREPDSRNFSYISIEKPSEAAKIFAVEKAIRSHTNGDVCSQDSEDVEKMCFAGSVAVPTFWDKLTVGVNKHDANIQVSVSGLKAEEDVFIAVSVLAEIFDCSLRNMVLMTKKNGGKVPDCFFDHDHYLYVCPEDAELKAK